MITLKKSNNIFYNKRVILDYFKSDLLESNLEIEDVNWLQLRISGEDNDECFELFLEKFFLLLKTKYFIDVFCYNRTEKKKSRTRSYFKLFYDLRKSNLINSAFLIEKELDTSKDHSVFTGIIQVDEVDNEIILNEIISDYFKFGHVELSNSNSEYSNRLENLIKKVDLNLLQNGRPIRINYLALLDKFVSPTSMVFSYLYDGKDDLVFTIYSGMKIFDQIEAAVIESLPKSKKVNKLSASSEEVDKLIASYFKDWRVVKR